MVQLDEEQGPFEKEHVRAVQWLWVGVSRPDQPYVGEKG